MKKILMLILFFTIGCAAQAVAADVQTIDKDELKRQMGSADLVILDVRRGSDWDSSEFKIKGSVRADPMDVEAWAKNFSPGDVYVLYCA